MLADYKFFGGAPSPPSQNQLRVICGEIISPQNASTASQSNLRLMTRKSIQMTARVGYRFVFLFLTK